PRNKAQGTFRHHALTTVADAAHNLVQLDFPGLLIPETPPRGGARRHGDGRIGRFFNGGHLDRTSEGPLARCRNGRRGGGGLGPVRHLWPKPSRAPVPALCIVRRPSVNRLRRARDRCRPSVARNPSSRRAPPGATTIAANTRNACSLRNSLD